MKNIKMKTKQRLANGHAHRSLGRPRSKKTMSTFLAESHSHPLFSGLNMAFGQTLRRFGHFLGRCSRLRCFWPLANLGRFIATILLTVVILPSIGTAADLSTTLHQAAKDSVAFCKKNDIKSVGTLKFLLTEGDKFSDNVGTINSLLAKRFDVALVLANDPREPITLIEDASATASKIEGASHLSKEGREKLFSVAYPAMWGSDSLKPDALIAGIGTVSPDMKKITFALLIASRERNVIETIGTDYVATISPAILTEVGESFSTRGAFDGGQFVETNDNAPSDLPDDLDSLDPGTQTILTSAKKVRESSTASTHPLLDPSAAVRLQVFYDGVSIPFDFKGGRALLKEPRTGQRVEVQLTKDSTAARYGVVVKLNGQNTLRKQQRPDASCGKWILAAPNQRVAIRGYQISNTELEEFRVLTQSESKQREVDYGSEVGQISITVFAEGKPPKLELDEDKRESQLVETARLPEEPSASFGALKAKLLADANRGLIAEGNRVQGQVRVVKFHANPTPVMSATATYYQP